MLKAAAYARYSSDNQREESIEAQLRAIREYCQKNDIQLVKIYTDEAKSATTDDRPGFLQMIQDSAMGLFSAVIVHKLDRFSRDRYDSAFYKRQLRKNGVRLISVLEHLDDSPESIILESVLEGMAEYYSRNLARETMKGMKETALKCKHTGGIPPLGFDVGPDKTYVINETEAEAIRLIFNMYADGHGYGAIIDTLNSKGYKTKRGNTFGKNSIHELLTNEKYIGTFVFNKASKMFNGKRNSHRLKPDDEIIRIPGGCPAIISNELWERVQARLKANKRASGAYSAKIVYLLSGRIFCGSCGGAMVGNRAKMGRNKTEYAYYGCSNRKTKRTCDMKAVNKAFIEEKVLDALYENLFADHVIDLATEMTYNHAATQNTEIPKQIATIEKQLGKVEIEIRNIVNAIAAGMFHESMKEKMDELEATKSTLRIRLEEAKLQQQTHSLSREQIRSFLARYRNIKEMPPEEQKKAVQVFVERITVYDDRIDMDILTIPSNSPSEKKNKKTASRPTGGYDETTQESGSGPLGSSLDLLVEAARAS
ncbi:MAG TPA: recombinase family protein [Bacillota bacterium]|nr:recombinase family protein [Bacillota bacterium]HOK69480.1 recombinase family protein [Bacillota bacterium]HPP86088.1 recombinase family protein [Bacillota bacterium]